MVLDAAARTGADLGGWKMTIGGARLPEPLQDGNPWGVPQRVDGVWRRPSPGTRSSANADAASEEGRL